MAERSQPLHKSGDRRQAKISKPSSKNALLQPDSTPMMNEMGFTSHAPLNPHNLNHHQLLQLQRTIGNRKLNQMIQRADPPAATRTLAPTLTPEQIERRNAAQAVLDAIKARHGLNVAVYLVNWNDDPKKYEKDDEFKTQAVQYAKDHLSFGVSDNKLKQGVPMGIDKSVAERLTQVVEKANALLDEFPELYSTKPNVTVETLSVFTHGGTTSLQAGAKKTKDGKDKNSWIGPATFVKGMAESMSFISTVNLYACSTAGVVKVGDNFATAIQKQLEADLTEKYGFAMVDVWGHTSAAHTTYNSNLVGVAQNIFGNDTEGDIKDELSKRLVMLVLGASSVELSEKDQKKLADKARSVIHKTLLPVDITYVKGKDGKKQRKEKWRTGPKDPLNTYFREISAFGINRVWEDLTAASDPTDYGSLGLSDDAQERMAQGIKEFRERFKPQLTEFQAEATKLIEASTTAEPTP